MNPAISVIVPCYNVEKYLAKCLESILSQSFSDFEVLCVDDCSTDRTPVILESYRQKLNGKIKVITHHLNTGLGGARNTGLTHATGEFIASVDSDDWIDKEMLERLYRTAVVSHADIVNIGFKSVLDDGSVIEQKQYRGSVLEMSEETDVFSASIPAFWNKLIRRQLFTKNNIRSPHTIADDLATTPRLIARASRVAYTEGTPYNYRARMGSEVRSASLKHLLGYVEVFQLLEDYFVDRLATSRGFVDNYCSMVATNIAFHVQMSEQTKPDHSYSQVACLLGIGCIDYITRTYGDTPKDHGFALRRRMIVATVKRKIWPAESLDGHSLNRFRTRSEDMLEA